MSRIVRHGSVGGDDNEEDDEEDGVGANVWDDAVYGDEAYNEALAADILDFNHDGTGGGSTNGNSLQQRPNGGDAEQLPPHTEAV